MISLMPQPASVSSRRKAPVSVLVSSLTISGVWVPFCHCGPSKDGLTGMKNTRLWEIPSAVKACNLVKEWLISSPHRGQLPGRGAHTPFPQHPASPYSTRCLRVQHTAWSPGSATPGSHAARRLAGIGICKMWSPCGLTSAEERALVRQGCDLWAGVRGGVGWGHGDPGSKRETVRDI